MAARTRLIIYFFIAFGLILTICLSASGLSLAYPPAGSGYAAWTGEAFAPNCYWGYHVQLACSAPYLYMVAEAPGAGTVNLWRTSDLNSLNWSYLCSIDPGPQACDPYIDAYGPYVAVSCKKLVGSSWAIVVKLSQDYGATWSTWSDSNPGWNNYEAHLVFAGDKLHCTYVSDYPSQGYNRNEVYYRRFGLGLGAEVLSCVSSNSDGVAASYPCIESGGMYNANVYYQHGNTSPHPIYESWTADGGSSFNITPDLIPTGGGYDFSFPECAVFWQGGDRRKIVVADGINTGTGFHSIYYARYYAANWSDRGRLLCDLGGQPSYPQVAAKGEALLVVYRGSGSTTGAEGQARINLSGGDGNWSFVDDLFYNNMPAPNCAPMDCISDGNRFYAASCGRGDHVEVMTKREDTTNPTVSIANPGTYHNTDFTVTANASDDFNRNEAWFLSPAPEAYQSGITHADFYYRISGGGWNDWPGGRLAADAPFSKLFPGASMPEGAYDFRVVATDTAQRVSENIMTGIVIDRNPPTADLQISGADGNNGWYINQPSFGPIVAGSDKGSGVKRTSYKFDTDYSWTVYSEPFALLEGEHTIHYFAEDNAGNTSVVYDFPYKADFSDPQGEIVGPSTGNYYQTEMDAKVQCNDAVSGVASIAWLIDGNQVFESASRETKLAIANLADGQHCLEAEIKDNAGRRYRTAPVLFCKDITPPTVDIIEPTGENWVRGMVTINADVRDNIAVDRAGFYIDNAKVDERTSAPWMAAWDTSTITNGYHSVRVEAWDKAGNQAEITASGETVVYVGNNISETNNFAEGCTRPGFDTWLCLQNPGEESANVTVTYYLGAGQGATSPRTYALPAHSRSTIYVNNDVGADKDVSIQVTSTRPIVSERPMYFDYRGMGDYHWKGCHTAQGAHFARQEWYFAEGCTRHGFESWLCLQNPEGQAAQVQVQYMMENGLTVNRSYTVAPWSRGTILINQEVGQEHDVSMHVLSTTPIVAERPVYFLYQGMWDGGHNVMGAAESGKEWYFAEGCTRTGFNQWICLMNPNNEGATATIDYVMEDGGRIERQYWLEPHSRFTVNVNNDVARQHDVSSHISSDLPIVVERPMYFLYNSTIDEGSNAMGSRKPGSSWYLAEGCTRAGFDEWICLMNPGEETAQVILRFMLETGSQKEHAVSVPAGTRVTVKVNDIVGPEHDVSTEVMSDRPIIVERPMYSNYRGSCPSGDTLSAYTFNP